jgi:hypothetical protein
MPKSITIVTAAALFACARPPARTIADPLAELREQVTALTIRVESLERTPHEEPTPKWSCTARCGHQSPRTSSFMILFRDVVGEGRSAAQAYKQLVDACDDGRLYADLVGEHFVGGDMKSACIESH